MIVSINRVAGTIRTKFLSIVLESWETISRTTVCPFCVSKVPIAEEGRESVVGTSKTEERPIVRLVGVVDEFDMSIL